MIFSLRTIAKIDVMQVDYSLSYPNSKQSHGKVGSNLILLVFSRRMIDNASSVDRNNTPTETKAQVPFLY